ncbi:hypothetical protein I302_103894 [Kwoniella bestiolae CBS 10118]|uniref:FYVE-type domain-containing protein n=1 Tax=Kwoniella bestiolae CBS 10118 TaxID=1296100 RepID=A0A1B9G9N9_9TREE|nr:hypothetical protein I302_02600 [Kwoniella bestiolae CBS 10118]OCF27754.1 hypothetical protein I302_02600 [Kwoniella bestiolae CBS 10118]
MASHSSSHSSLLQLNRPDSLLPQLPTSNEVAQHNAQAQWLEQHEQVQQQLCRSKGSASDLASQDAAHLSTSSNSQSSSSSSSAANKLQPVASSSSGLNYLNMEPVSSPSLDVAIADVCSPLSECEDNRQICAEMLATAHTGVMGEVIDRSKWQPDADSALCTYPLCTANFAQPTYFFLGPRRHHCRMCGQLFCSSHSSQRGSLVSTDISGKRRIVKERVCDLCVSNNDDHHLDNVSQPRSNQHSRRNSTCTESASEDHDHHSDLVTPYDEDGHGLLSASGLLRAQSRLTLNTSNLPAEPELAPIEDWMDRSGVLSLYPLAVNPSHSKSSTLHPSAGPLFSPSQSMRREAKEKQLERLTLRQRRMGNKTSMTHDDFWLPGKWGYRREDFDPTLGEYDDSEQIEKYVGGMVEDGPIRFRTGVRKVVTPLTTPNGGPVGVRN